jgi:hypothetical protein
LPLRGFIAIFLSTLLSLQLPLMAQDAQGPAPQKLSIVIVEGEGAINNIRQRVAREPIVQVEDENRKPVAGASVVFLLPGNGAGGAFVDGSRMLTVVTDQNGQAVMRGFTPNNVTGKYQVRVTASHRGQTTTATISQSNIAAAAGAGAAAGSGKLIAIIAVVGGAAAAGIAVAATRGNGNNGPTGPTTPVPTPTVISPGSPTVGPPR